MNNKTIIVIYKMQNFIYYCKDFEKFGNAQEWKTKIKDKEITFQAKRGQFNSWEVSAFFQSNVKKLTFDSNYDYKPQSSLGKGDYWTFSEVKCEIENLIFQLATISPSQS